jgi:hypothetical protein
LIQSRKLVNSLLQAVKAPLSPGPTANEAGHLLDLRKPKKHLTTHCTNNNHQQQQQSTGKVAAKTAVVEKPASKDGQIIIVEVPASVDNDKDTNKRKQKNVGSPTSFHKLNL